MQFLKRKGTKLLMKHDNVIWAFANASDNEVPDMYLREIEVTEENSYPVLEKMLVSREVEGFECRMDVNGKTMWFSCDTGFNDSLCITILPDSILLDDGMIDFNWYYKFWKEMFPESTYMYGVEFSAID